MNDKNLNIRTSARTLALIKAKALANGISQSKLVKIAVESLTEDEILQHLLDKVVK